MWDSCEHDGWEEGNRDLKIGRCEVCFLLEEEEAATALSQWWEKPAGALWCDMLVAQAAGDQEEAGFSVLFYFHV